MKNEPSFHAPDMENNCCHLAESWASRPYCFHMGWRQHLLLAKKDRWGQKTDSKHLLANSHVQAGPLNL